MLFMALFLFIVFNYLLVLMLVIAVLLGLVWLLMYTEGSCREKYSVFECGFDLISLLRLPFSLHFYFISIIFLVFDVEVILLLPFIYLFKFSSFLIVWLMLFFFFWFFFLVFFMSGMLGF